MITGHPVSVRLQAQTELSCRPCLPSAYTQPPLWRQQASLAWGSGRNTVHSPRSAGLPDWSRELWGHSNLTTQVKQRWGVWQFPVSGIDRPRWQKAGLSSVGGRPHQFVALASRKLLEHVSQGLSPPLSSCMLTRLQKPAAPNQLHLSQARQRSSYYSEIRL